MRSAWTTARCSRASTGVWQGDRESLGLVLVPDVLELDSDEYVFPPALLDACLQVVVAADANFDQRNGGLYLPHEIEAVRLFRRPGHRVWVHARLLEKTPHRSVSDVDIYNEDGQLAARVRGLRSHRVAGGRDESLDDLLYAYQWRPQPRSEADFPPELQSWLIFADNGGSARGSRDELSARGDVCTVVYAGSTFEDCGQGNYRINPDRPEDVLRLLQAIVGSGHVPCRGVVHLWNLDAPPPDELSAAALQAAQGPGLLSVVWLVQAWDRLAPDRSARLLLVTRGAQSVGGPTRASRRSPRPPRSGWGGSLPANTRRLRCKLVDLDPGADDGGARSLLEEIQSADEEDEVAWRGPERYVHRFLPAPGLPSEDATGPVKDGVPYRLTCARPGTLDGLVLQKMRRRPPGPGEVEIEVVAAGLNFSDVMKALGMYPGLARRPGAARCRVQRPHHGSR